MQGARYRAGFSHAQTGVARAPSPHVPAATALRVPDRTAARIDWHYNCSARCMIDLNYAPAPPMDPSEIYAKTELGLAELRDRKLNLPITLRGLLILIDGNRTVAQVLVKARALKLDERAMTALERGGLIAKRFSAPSVAQNDATMTPAQRSEDEVERYMQAQQMMSDAINAHLGFRGYGLMMRLQKTANVRDLHDLLPDFAKSLVKRLGIEPATPIVSSIERLITGN
jgi:hypothetical protein